MVGVVDLLGGVATLLGGVVEETFSDGTSSGFEVIEGGGALVLRIRSTLMFATIFIISISPVCMCVCARACVCVCVCVWWGHTHLTCLQCRMPLIHSCPSGLLQLHGDPVT